MTQPTDIQALRTPTPERQAFCEVIGEALDSALERDSQTIRAALWYSRVHPNGLQDTPEQCRQIDFPADGADPGQVVDQIATSYSSRAPGDGFVGRIKVVLSIEDEGNTLELGTFERFIHIGDVNHQQGMGGAYLPPPPGMGMPPQFGGFGGGAMGPPPMGPSYPPHGMGPMGPMGPMQNFAPGSMEMDEMDEEKQGMLLAMMGANERRLDMHMREKQYLLDRMMDTNTHLLQSVGYVMQLANVYMNRYQPPPPPASTGGDQNAIASIVGGLISMMLGGGGGAAKEAVPNDPHVPIPPNPMGLPPEADAYVPYEPPMAPSPMGEDLHPSDITEEAANAWAAENPDAAKRVARNLLPPAMQTLIPQ